MKLDYFQDGRFYNGLLSKQTWLHGSSSGAENSHTRTYTYDYDKANRYNNALFSGSASENYNENASYDANGNILNLNRFGEFTDSSFGKIDSLAYSYSTNSNRLNGITDLANNTKGHKDNGNASDYTYYSDGSQKTDANKGITNTIYNYLGLQDEIQFGSTAKIKNVYTADGQKIIQYLINGTDTLRTDYVGDLIYKNKVLETVFHNEGRIKVALDTSIVNRSDTLGNHYSDTTIALNTRYQYFIQDQLGNNRVIFEKLNDSLFVAQHVDYYPFGSPFSESLFFSFTYQNKEYINFFGYDIYDFGWRQGDSWTGRWTSPDPANQFLSMTPYNFMGGNPVSNVDPDGQFVWFVWAGAAVIGGTSNLISNWSKIKNIKQGLAYFGSGAIGGVVSLTPAGFWGGSATTAGLNVGIDVVTGNLPNLDKFGDYAKYGLNLGLSGIGAGGAGSLSQLGYKGLSALFSSNASVSISGGSGATIVERFADGGFSSVANYEVVVKPAI